MAAFRIVEDAPVMGRKPLVDLERFEKSLQVPSGIVPTAGRSRKRRQIVPETAAQAVDGKPIQRRILGSDTERFRQTVVGLRPLGGDAQSPIEQRCRTKCRLGFHDCPLPFALPFSSERSYVLRKTRPTSRGWARARKFLPPPRRPLGKPFRPSRKYLGTKKPAANSGLSVAVLRQHR